MLEEKPRQTRSIYGPRGRPVTPRDRCVRCPPVIRCCLPCHFLCVMHCISCHHVHFICIRDRLMHSSIFPVVRFAIRRSLLLRWSFLPFFLVWGLNISGLDRDFPSSLGLLPVDRLPSFVPFGLRLILQRLPRDQKGLVCVSAQHPSNLAQNPPKPSPSYRAFDHDPVAENRTSFGLS